MTEEHIIQPEKYEVIRLITGSEFICMTIEKEDVVLAILPMVCFLTDAGNQTTRVSYQPYCATTSDINIVVKKEHILHRSDLHPQYIPLYDAAASKWMEMMDDHTIPIDTSGMVNDKSVEDQWDEYLDTLDEMTDPEADNTLH